VRHALTVFLLMVLAGLASGGEDGAFQLEITERGRKTSYSLVEGDDAGLLVRSADGRERRIPAAQLKLDLFLTCRIRLLPRSDAKGHFVLGQTALNNGQEKEAESLLGVAAQLDPVAYRQKVERLLKKRADAVRGVPGGKSTEEVEKHLAERLAMLNREMGGGWRMDETEHFLHFSNLPMPCHQRLKRTNEDVYKSLSGTFGYRERRAPWDGKCEMYYFAKREQFDGFAVKVHSIRNASALGGFFHHGNREATVLIPSETEDKSEAAVLRLVNGMVYHELTHAFTSLCGRLTPLNSWLHEGMAVYMEFQQEPRDHPKRREMCRILAAAAGANRVLSWAESRERPRKADGGDTAGYAWAWSRVAFLYHLSERASDRGQVWRFIQLVKDGKTEEGRC